MNTTENKTSVCCDAFKIIRPSRKDTKETKKQIYIHNEVYEEMCLEEKENKQ